MTVRIAQTTNTTQRKIFATSMAGITSNLDDILAAIDRAAAVDFTAPTPSGVLGGDLVEIVVNGIRDRTVVRQEGPSGAPLAANAPAYAKRKGYRPVGIGPDRKGAPSGGDMLGEVNLRGEVDIRPDEVAMTFGASDWARDKGRWFTHGSDESAGHGNYSGAKGQPARPFYALDDAIRAALDERIDKFLEEHLESP